MSDQVTKKADNLVKDCLNKECVECEIYQSEFYMFLFQRYLCCEKYIAKIQVTAIQKELLMVSF